MRQLLFLILLFQAFFPSSLSADGTELADRNSLKADRPNVVFLVSEDNSKHYLRLFDEHGAATPNIEALAETGLTFRNAFSNSPVCSVARTTLATGCYAPRIGTQFHRKSKAVPLPEDLEMFPAYLREAGYYTTNKQKTDYNAIPGENVWDESSRNASWRNRAADQPFFHMQSFAQSHEGRLHFPVEDVTQNPTNTPPESVFIAPYHPQTETFAYTNARYLDCIRTIDDQIGRVVEQLREDNLLDDTFIFYFGDHGGVLPRGKGYIYESGLHIPLVVSVPENYRNLAPAAAGGEINGFVSFIDFGPTVLNLCGVNVPDQMDGSPFLGAGTTLEAIEARDEAVGYADRFDEKYDLVRSLRKGDLKYMRNFTPFNFDGLQNNYRYQMAAYREWRELYLKGELNEIQSQFFEARPAEALYDLSSDPYETVNLIDDPRYAESAAMLRNRLFEIMSEMPDLSLYPESHLIAQAFDNPVEFGQLHRENILALMRTANLALGDFEQNRPELEAALADSDQWQRYWGIVACSCYGSEAAELSQLIQRIAAEDECIAVRIRAAEFLGLTGSGDPVPVIRKALLETTSPVEVAEILNTVVLLRDGTAAVDCNITRQDVPAGLIQPKGEVERRMDYLDPIDE